MTRSAPLLTTGFIVIGRNEGDRLERSLRSVSAAARVVYVDSGSTDHSVARARNLGVEVVSLDEEAPFTAARARNAGFNHLVRRWPELDWIQFVDGDCELDPEWIGEALAALVAQPTVAVVSGRLEERNADASVYNRLCAMEWNRPAGETDASGGIAMVRRSAFDEVGGFDSKLIAGEEPDFCIRLRRNGWKILRLDATMASHDAAITNFSQWWTRMVRGGHAFAGSATRHGLTRERYGVRESLSIWFWAVFVPVISIGLVSQTAGWSLLGFSLYPVQVARIAHRRKSRGDETGDAWLYAFFCMLAKWPQWLGQVRFVYDRALRKAPQVIEYKGIETGDREGGQVPT